jgi:hypothetical protein
MKNLRDILAAEGLITAAADPTWDRIGKAWAMAKAGINKVQSSGVSYFKVMPEAPTKLGYNDHGAYMSYKFMSTWAAHDDQLWEISAKRSRGIILKALKSVGAKIGSVPPMNDFGTKDTPFTLDGRPFEFGFYPHRYDMGLFINPVL